MASEADCDRALRDLADLLAEVPADVRGRYVLERTVSCRVPDLGVTWSARLCDEGLVGITTGENPKAQVRVSVASDDLVALVEGRQSLASAVATGRVRVHASPRDMLRLTNLI